MATDGSPSKQKWEEMMATPFKFNSEIDVTDVDCANWMNDMLQNVSVWTFV